jgi:molybdate transport system substrate-binding protein
VNVKSWTSTGYRTALRISALAVLSLLFCVLLGRTAVAQSNVVNVAAAADMQPVFEAVGPIFEQKSGLKLKISYASSATLSQQLQNGSPADIFFSADFYFAEQVVSANLTESKQPEPYAKGLLVLWTAKNSRFKPLSLDVLSRKDLTKVAMADPDRAPYGRAALAALRKMNYFVNVQPHIVQAESVAQAAQFALSGNAELALISQTIAMSPKYRNEGSFVLFPLSQYPDIRQCAVIMKDGRNRDGAHALLKFMLSDQVQENLPKLGLQAVK